MEFGATIKTEEAADTSAACIDIEIDLSHLKQEPGLVQSEKSELAMFVKKEFVENISEDDSEQQCDQAASTPAGTGCLYEANTPNQGDWVNVKPELEEIDIGPTVLQHMDIHYALNKSAVDGCKKGRQCSRVKKGAVDKLKDYLNPHKALRKERSRLLQSLQYTVHEDCLASLCRVDVMRLDVFQCDLCHVVYTEKLRLLQHLQTLHACPSRTSLSVRFRQTNKRNVSGNIIICGYSGETTVEEDFNKAHLKSCLGQQKGFQQRLLRRHQTTSSNCFRCDTCGKAFCKLHLLSTHRKTHQRNSAISGATSSSVVSPSNVRRSEAAKAETKPFKCDVCDKGYSSEATLSIHKRFHSGVGLSACHICSSKFNTKSNLTIHLRTHTGQKPYSCDICRAKFTASDDLIKHKRVHTGEKPYQCDNCNARFTTSSYLTTHKRVHSGEKPYQCDTCNARFTTSGNLTKHKRVHTGEKPFQCDNCDASFSQSSHLTTHKKLHSGENTYQCDTCNARFTTYSYLTLHKRVHSGKKPYQCDSCDASFSQSSHLITHKRFHSGDKPYQCDTCNARFTTSGNLTSHKRVHSGEKPFECTECPAKFTHKCNLNQHMRRRHLK